MRPAFIGCLAFLTSTGLAPTPARAQTVIFGSVRSNHDSVAIADAAIAVYKASKDRQLVRPALRRATTNAAGQFRIALPSALPVALVTGAPGFQLDTTFFTVTNSVGRIEIWLRRAVAELPPITAHAGRDSALDPISGLDLIRTAAELRIVPAAGGVEDPIRALAAEPGVRLADPYSARLVVRGADPSGNGAYLNGFPVRNLYHLGGLFGGLPATSVNEAHLWFAAPPPRYDGFSGSVMDLDVTAADAGSPQFTAIANILSVEATGSLAHPAGHELRLAARRSWLGPLWTTSLGVREFGIHDYLLSGTWRPGPAWSVSMLAFESADAAEDSTQTFVPETNSFSLSRYRYERNSRVLGARLAHEVPGTARIEVAGWVSTAQAGGISLRLNGAFEEADADVRLHEVGADLRLSGVAEVHQWYAGLRVQQQSIESNVTYFNDLLDGASSSRPATGSIATASDRSRLRAYVGDEVSTGRLGTITLGAGALVSGSTKIEPSLIVHTPVSPSVTLHLAAARRYQTEYLMIDPRQEPWVELSAVDIWLQEGDTTLGAPLPAARTDQGVIGGTLTLRGGLSLSLDGYYKRFTDLPELRAPDSRDEDAAPNLLVVNGEAAGLEARVQWRPHEYWMVASSYSWSRSWRNTDSSEYLSNFDVPHRLKFLVSCAPVSGWFASANTTLESGYPYTSVIGTYPLKHYDPYRGFIIPPWNGGAGFVRGPRNSARYPMTHRLDVRVGYRSDVDQAVRWELFAAVLNLTGGQSIPFTPERALSAPGASGVQVQLTEEYALPPIPLIGVRVEF